MFELNLLIYISNRVYRFNYFFFLVYALNCHFKLTFELIKFLNFFFFKEILIKKTLKYLFLPSAQNLKVEERKKNTSIPSNCHSMTNLLTNSAHRPIHQHTNNT